MQREKGYIYQKREGTQNRTLRKPLGDRFNLEESDDLPVSSW